MSRYSSPVSIAQTALPILALALMALAAPSNLPAVSEAKTCVAEPGITPLAYGDVYSTDCVVTPAGDLDQFEFTAAAGDVIRLIGLDRTGPGSQVQICVQLLGPDPDLPIQACNNETAIIDKQLTASGSYLALVTENGNDGAMPYHLSLERLFPARNEWSAVTFGIVENDELNPAADVDIRRMTAVQGDFLRFILTDLTGPGSQVQSCLEVIGPGGGGAVPLICDNLSLQIDLPVIETGVYGVIVSETGHNSQMPYDVNVECLFGPSCASKPPICDTSLSLSDETLTLDFLLRTQNLTSWSVYLAYFNQVNALWSIPLPALDPAFPASLPVPNFPNLGPVGVLSTFATANGIVCSDWETIDTGTPAQGALSQADVQSHLSRIRARRPTIR